MFRDEICEMKCIEDCSQFNPCGKNGYCRNKANGDWKCSCKFWWNGTVCNECEYERQMNEFER